MIVFILSLKQIKLDYCLEMYIQVVKVFKKKKVMIVIKLEQ